MGATGDQRDVTAGLAQAATNDSADRACAEDHVSHRRHCPWLVEATGGAWIDQPTPVPCAVLSAGWSAAVSRPSVASAIALASTAAAPARCRSCQAGGAFSRALTMPRVAVARTNVASAAARLRAPRLADQRRQACTENVSSAIPASPATLRCSRCGQTRSPDCPEGHSGKLAHAFSAPALTTREPETNSTLAAPMATQAIRPRRGPGVDWPGTRAHTAVTVEPPSIATPAIRWAATVGAPLLANTVTAPRAICTTMIAAVNSAGRTALGRWARALTASSAVRNVRIVTIPAR